MIDSLKPNQIFVFGSNQRGQHTGGAAKTAAEKYGAIMGMEEGLQGKSYAFPTLTVKYEKRERYPLELSVTAFYRCAEQNPDKEFLMTPVGTGIAGYTHEEMKSLFSHPPSNVILPQEWL